MKSRSARFRRALRNWGIGVLSCAAFAAWTYQGARRKSLNIGLLEAVADRQEDLRHKQQKDLSYAGHTDKIEDLLQQGADPNVHTQAYPYGSFPAEMSHRFQRGMLSFSYWRYEFRDEALAHDPRESGPSLLWKAVEDRDKALFNTLLRYGADSNASYENWERKNVTLLMLTAKWGDADAMRHLLQRHPHINIRDSLGATPLHYTIYDYKFEAARLLLQSGANPNVWDNFGYTPLMNIAMFAHNVVPEKDVIAIENLLLLRHANVNQRNKYHKTALTIAREQHNDALIPLLLQHGATE